VAELLHKLFGLPRCTLFFSIFSSHPLQSTPTNIGTSAAVFFSSGRKKSTRATSKTNGECKQESIVRQALLSSPARASFRSRPFSSLKKLGCIKLPHHAHLAQCPGVYHPPLPLLLLLDYGELAWALFRSRPFLSLQGKPSADAQGAIMVSCSKQRNQHDPACRTRKLLQLIRGKPPLPRGKGRQECSLHQTRPRRAWVRAWSNAWLNTPDDLPHFFLLFLSRRGSPFVC
jgi:hypothetical protein